MSEGVSAAQVVLEETLDAAIEAFWDARANGEESQAAVLYHVLSTAKANAKALGLDFDSELIRQFDPDTALKIVPTRKTEA